MTRATLKKRFENKVIFQRTVFIWSLIKAKIYQTQVFVHLL